MKKLVANERGFIPMMIAVIVVVVALIVIVYMRVHNAS